MNNGTEQIFLLNAAPNQSSAPTQRMGAIAPPPSSTQVNLDNVEDFSHVCRICATITELVMPILSGEGLQNKLGSKIKKHLPITVRERDELPLVICYQCANTLLAWHELVKCCVQADLALHAKIAANKRKNNPSNNVTVKSSAIVQDEPQSKLYYTSVTNALTEFNLDEDDTDVEFVCQKCVEKPALTTTQSLAEHIRHDHSLDILNNGVKTYITNYVTFEQVLAEDSDRETQSETKEKPQVVLPSLHCPFCVSVFSSATRLLYHLNKHDEVRAADGVGACCDLVYNDKKLFVQHLQEAHVRKPSEEPVCVSCGFTTDTIDGLKQHYKDAHGDVKSTKEKKVESPNNQKYIPAVCPECNKSFSNKYNMFAHMRSHSRAAVYPCDKCTRTYSNQGNLTQHQKLAHQGILEYVCGECGEAFPRRSERDTHARLHSGHAPHRCALCGKAYRSRNTLTKHLEIHADIRKYECEICSKKFRRKSHLDYHVKTHMKYIPDSSPPAPATQRYRVCVYCATSHPVAKYREHLAVNHFKLLFHCEDCDNLVDRREFRQHLSYHASQLKYRRKKAQNNNQAPTPAPTNIVPKCSPKIESPKPIIKTKEENTPVPVTINAPVPVKIDMTVPVTINAAVSVKIDTSVPVTVNAPVPDTINAPVPDTINAPVPVTINAPVPDTINAPVPVNINTPVPVKINTPVPVKINTPVSVKIDTPVQSTIDKTSVQENEFSDHSDTEGFGPLPESVFDAFEDSQDGQQSTQPAGTTTDAPDTEQPKDESIKSDAIQNNDSTNPTICLENNNNMNNCSVVIEPMKIQNCAQPNIATRNRSVMNIFVPPENKSLPQTAELNNKQSTDEKGKKNQKTRKCPFCSKEYRASSSYFYHLKHSHEGAKEHECEVCGRKLYSKSSLTQHMTIHTSYYDYECSQCEKRFKTKAGLYIHEQTHTGTKSFACNHCDTSFRWRTHLTRHMARHAAERAHVCGACGRAFSVRCDLLRHARTHAAGNFACDKCGRKFAQLRYLKVHTTKQHARHSRRLTK